MKILIGYDGSEWARTAVSDLARAGLPPEARVEVIAAADVWLPPPEMEGEDDSTMIMTAAVASARKKAEAALERARGTAREGAALLGEIFPDWEVEARAVADAPAWAIVKRATSWPADLVVVGSHGHSTISRLLLGSVSQKVLVEAPCSVRIGRRNERERNAPVRLVIGVDGSVDAEAAIEMVAGRAWPAGSEARLLTAIDLKISTSLVAPEGAHGKWIEAGDESASIWVERMQTAMATRLRAAGLEVSMLSREEDPKQMLLGEAERWQADAIFLGARGHSLVERLVVGSVSTSIAAQARCAVEIVRRVS